MAPSGWIRGGNTDLLFYAFSKDFQEFGAVLRIYFAHICNLEHSHFIEDAFAGINRIAVFFHEIWAGSMPAMLQASDTAVRMLSHISIGSCSTQPG